MGTGDDIYLRRTAAAEEGFFLLGESNHIRAAKNRLVALADTVPVFAPWRGLLLSAADTH